MIVVVNDYLQGKKWPDLVLPIDTDGINFVVYARVAVPPVIKPRAAISASS
jgi:hypothetical protein